jgi:phosphatidylserine decarboxylase
MNFEAALKVWPQHILPQHGLSKLMSKLTHSQNRIVKNLLIRQVIKRYGVDMSEAKEENSEHFKSFNEFFTRELKPGIRPIAEGNDAIACPADGMISQCGAISGEKLLQAKGSTFTVFDLLGRDLERAHPFYNGSFATIYLSPKDYHRLHMPVTGTLREMVHVPGRLFSVNEATARSVPGLFARNERVVAIFETELGLMALVLVGAIFVSSIETVWHGVVSPPTAPTVQTWDYRMKAEALKNKPIVLNKGEEMGRFNMGSTIIVLFEKDKMAWSDLLAAGQVVKLGQEIGRINRA